ncbi:uncharacterized protein LOC129318950 [Prosopis cineraria]|uniref:uncharacterized protein LOC129318950 n=1 Tax=Prosopis cineraria TaxID=364024 RepID=UPI0024101253|nr:uncharacterized protein LOC129318950 [Prosopis cineraria]
MGNSLRCCLACVLPCGALDLIRIVHLNGFVEELTGPITADEVLKANPNHVLTRPTSQGVVRRILVLSPDTELKRGSIYFLIPSSSVPDNKKTSSSKKTKIIHKKTAPPTDFSSQSDARLPLSADIASSEKKSSRRDRRSGHAGIWRPHLESISED